MLERFALLEDEVAAAEETMLEVAAAMEPGTRIPLLDLAPRFHNPLDVTRVGFAIGYGARGFNYVATEMQTPGSEFYRKLAELGVHLLTTEGIRYFYRTDIVVRGSVKEGRSIVVIKEEEPIGAP